MPQWTPAQYELLSIRIAKKFNLNCPYPGLVTRPELTKNVWIHDDWHIIMELCSKYNIRAGKLNSGLHLVANKFPAVQNIQVPVADHNNDAALAERVARMIILLDIGIKT